MTPPPWPPTRASTTASSPCGLVWGLVADDPTGFRVRVFFLSCVVIAGIYGAATANRRILFAQALPGALALSAVLVSH